MVGIETTERQDVAQMATRAVNMSVAEQLLGSIADDLISHQHHAAYVPSKDFSPPYVIICLNDDITKYLELVYFRAKGKLTFNYPERHEFDIADPNLMDQIYTILEKLIKMEAK